MYRYYQERLYMLMDGTYLHARADHNPPPFEVRGLYRAKDHPDRKMAESILSRRHPRPTTARGGCRVARVTS